MCKRAISNTVSYLQILGSQRIGSIQEKVFDCFNEMTNLSFDLADKPAILFLIGNSFSPNKRKTHQLLNQRCNIGV